jgi:cytochrome P450
MAGGKINEKQVDQDIEQIRKIREMAWHRSPENLLALSERLQVILLTEDVPRRRRQVYRALIDYFEDVLEERIEKDDDTDAIKVRRTAGAYLRGILKTLDK